MSAYQRKCHTCNRPIIMAQDHRGNWQPLNIDGSGRHSCNSISSDSNSLSVINDISTTKIAEAKTKPGNCFVCRANVFYHTNGYGDCVLLDDLGWPWQIHFCWEQYMQDKRSFIDLRFNAHKFNKSEYLKKRRLIAEVIQQLKISHIRPTEWMVAPKMGVTTEQLRDIYSDVYTIKNDQLELREKITLPDDNLNKKLLNAFTECPNCQVPVKQKNLQKHNKICKGKPAYSS